MRGASVVRYPLIALGTCFIALVGSVGVRSDDGSGREGPFHASPSAERAFRSEREDETSGAIPELQIGASKWAVVNELRRRGVRSVFCDSPVQSEVTSAESLGVLDRVPALYASSSDASLYVQFDGDAVVLIEAICTDAEQQKMLQESRSRKAVMEGLRKLLADGEDLRIIDREPDRGACELIDMTADDERRLRKFNLWDAAVKQESRVWNLKLEFENEKLTRIRALSPAEVNR